MITLIAALADNGVIGRDGDLPWRLPDDLARFKALTLGHTLVMGRKTFESIGRPLPGRHTIVVTRSPDWRADGVAVAHSVDEAIGAIPDGQHVFVAGGGEIYAATIDRADRLELTHVDRVIDGDTHFPAIDPARWRPIATDARDGYTFVTYQRDAQAGRLHGLNHRHDRVRRTRQTSGVTTAGIEAARRAFAERAWSDVVAMLESQRDDATMEAADLERLAVAAYLVGRDDAAERAMARAHDAWLVAGDVDRAGRCAFWIGLTGAIRGDIAQANGWYGRGRRVIAGVAPHCAARGYLLVPTAMDALSAGDTAAADATYGDVLTVAEECGDADLLAIALLGRGEVAIAAGDLSGGLALLDEAMIAVTTDQLSPLAVGILYCAVLDACMEALDLARAREWTAAFTRWCEGQPELVQFRGACLIHRSQVLQRDGRWAEAIELATDAAARLRDPPHPAEGAACYQRGELHRVRGEYTEAGDCYRSAREHGRDPVPGIALLRLSAGRIDAAVEMTRRMLSEATGAPARLAVLPAAAEVFVGAGDLDAARAASDDLTNVARAAGSTFADALAAHAAGVVALAGDDSAAASLLRDAVVRWRRLAMPYECARAQELAGLAARALGDRESGDADLRAAQAAFERLGAGPDAARVAAQLGAAAAGDAGPLTERELEVLRLVVAGRTNRQIGESLVISEHTVARHVQNIFTKLGVTSRAAATAYAYEHQLV